MQKHKIIFYPVGNGDTSQIILDNGKRILIDYRHQKQGEDDDAPHIDLKKQLENELSEAKRDYFDVVAFTHGDKDHIANSTEFFELLHSDKYQGDNRKKINELWVPAAMILETATNDQQSDEFVIWRQEARYRLKKGEGIRVFSKPEKLKEWLEENGLTLESRRHLITDAGTVVDGFTLEKDGIEFFCHSPFIKHVDDSDEMRNEAALIFQIRLKAENTIYNYFAIGDSTYGVLEDVVEISNKHGNGDRLDWDLFNIPHHCSYQALAEEKGDKETTPTDGVIELLEHGQKDAYMVSSSNPIADNNEAYKQEQPPHIQTKKAYLKYLKKINGRKFLVTMEEPNDKNPKPIEFEITGNGCKLISKVIMGSAAIIGSSAPRAGRR